MPLVSAKCTQCGANLDVNPEQETAICPFCHAKYVTEKAINNYNTTNVTNIANLHMDVMNLVGESELDIKIKSGETFLSLKQFENAKKLFGELVKEHPYSYKAWLGLAESTTLSYTLEDVSFNFIDDVKSFYDNAVTVFNETELTEEFEVCKNYITVVQSKLNRKKAELEYNAKKDLDEYCAFKAEYDIKIKNGSKKRYLIERIIIFLWLNTLIFLSIKLFSLPNGSYEILHRTLSVDIPTKICLLSILIVLFFYILSGSLSFFTKIFTTKKESDIEEQFSKFKNQYNNKVQKYDSEYLKLTGKNLYK